MSAMLPMSCCHQAMMRLDADALPRLFDAMPMMSAAAPLPSAQKDAKDATPLLPRAAPLRRVILPLDLLKMLLRCLLAPARRLSLTPLCFTLSSARLRRFQDGHCYRQVGDAYQCV